MSKIDETEPYRHSRVAELNAEAEERSATEEKHGQVWNTVELSDEFDMLGFSAPFVVVVRKSDNQKGSLEFQHSPRYYFNWQPS